MYRYLRVISKRTASIHRCIYIKIKNAEYTISRLDDDPKHFVRNFYSIHPPL